MGLRPAAHRAGDHFDEPAHPVLFVDDVVAGFEVERVDLVAPAAGRQAAHVPSRGGCGAAEHIGLGEDGELHRVDDESAEVRGRRHGHRARGGGLGEVVDEPGRHIGFGEHLDHPLTRAAALRENQNVPAVMDEYAHIAEDRLDVAGVAAWLPAWHLEYGLTGGLGQFGIAGEAADLPPRQTARSGGLAGLLQGAEAGRRQIDRHLPACSGRRPCGGEELLGRGDEVLGPGCDLLRGGHEDPGASRQGVNEGLHLSGEHRGEGLHAFDSDAVGDLLEHLSSLRQLWDEAAGTCADFGGQQHFAARRGP